MLINFSKYQGTGNDFVIIDLINDDWVDRKLIEQNVEHLCDRRYGVGADGLIIIDREDDYDFRMIYYNSDGKQSSMCGNGGRCAAHFYYSYVNDKAEISFIAIDGPHLAKIDGKKISLQMLDVSETKSLEKAYELNTGSPHYVRENEEELSEQAFRDAAIKVRYSEAYKEEGINVNFYNEVNNKLRVTTYERGVEDLTFSCGTGVTAVAMAYGIKNKLEGNQDISISTKGGDLSVSYKKNKNNFTNVWLSGPAVESFKGIVEL